MCTAGSSLRHTRAVAGLTLLELLVVLVIASLMLVLVAPNIGSVLPGSELKTFTRQSAAMLRELRSEAVNQSRNRQLGLDQEVRSYRSGTELLMPWPDGIDVQLTQGAIPDFMRDPFNDQSVLMFFPDGSSNGGILSVHTESLGGYSIEVDALSGRIWIDER